MACIDERKKNRHSEYYFVLLQYYLVDLVVPGMHTRGVPETHLCLVIIIMSNLRKITRTFRNPQVLEYSGVLKCSYSVQVLRTELSILRMHIMSQLQNQDNSPTLERIGGRRSEVKDENAVEPRRRDDGGCIGRPWRGSIWS